MRLTAPLVAAAFWFAPLAAVVAQQPASMPAEAATGPKPGARARADTKPADPKAGDAKATTDAKPAAEPKLSVTEHEATLGGKRIKYKATAGTYPLKDEAGKTKADVFFVAYEKTPSPASADEMAARPLTFVFNGGPGAASVWLHLGTAGPKRVKLTDLGEAPPPPYRLVDNDSSWLDATDLVFIDPVGTGYSRPAPGEDPKQFYGVEEDLRWVSEFIRLYTTRNLRWPSPKFLAGESYGTTRAAALSEHLLENQGIAVNGVILISTVLDFATLRSADNNDLPYPLFLPTYTAIAHYHKRLKPDLQKQEFSKTLKEAETFALGGYAAALAKGDSLPGDAKEQVAAEVARLTGLEPAAVLKSNLRVDAELFRKLVLDVPGKAGGTVVGRYDGRLTGYDPDPLGRDPDHDPSFNQFFALYGATFNDYARRTLKYETDVPYDVLTGRVQPWNFGNRGNSGYLTVADNLGRAMRKSPHTKLLVCAGLYDLATPYLAAGYTLRHLKISPELQKNVTETFYPGGHMLYHEAGALKQLKADVAAFIAASTK
ncbi:MAG: peptidase serine carboxypeptidase [Phycisphaerales bacterium]|nr:peptidase serine carboxypeptidase [Phycisphaerales bacterium]